MDRLDPAARVPDPLSACEVYSEQVHLLVDRELGAAETARVEEHLQGCPRCQGLTIHLERMSDVLRAWDQREGDVGVPEARLQRAVLGRVQEQGARRRRDDRHVQLRQLATAALVLVALGAGVALGLGQRTTPAGAPDVQAVTARGPWPLEAVAASTPAPLADDAARGPSADDLLRRVQAPAVADLPSRDAGPWDPDVFRAQDQADGLPLLVQRFVRKQAFESRFGERALYWMGPRLGDEPRLVTESVYRFLQDRRFLAEWRKRDDEARGTSRSVASLPDPMQPGRSTGMTAREMLSPMPGVDQRLDLAPETRLVTVQVPRVAVGAGSDPKERKPAEILGAVTAWPVGDPLVVVPGLRSGLQGTKPQRFLDPVDAWGNGQLRFAESQHDAGLIVAFVKDTTEPIFLPAGQILSDGLADRVIAHPTWLPAGRETRTYPIRCMVIQGMPRDESQVQGPPQLTPLIAGPTIRALLAAEASQAEVKEAARRIVAAWRGAFGVAVDPWEWSLLPFYARNAGPQIASAFDAVRWGDAHGFLVTDAHGRLAGFELVRAQGSAARELMRRLWLGYVAEGSWRLQGEAAGQAFSAPTDVAAQVLRRLGTLDAHFRVSRGANAPHGTCVSHLDANASGLSLHALEVDRAPTVVSGLATPARPDAR